MKVGYKQIEKNHLIEIDNEKGIKIYLSRVGASLHSIYYRGQLMTLTPQNVGDFLKTNCFYGKTIGPTFEKINNIVTCINNPLKTKIEKEKLGLNAAIFDVAEFHNKNGLGAVIFKFGSKREVFGLSGNIIYQVSYGLNEKNEIEISLNALGDQDAPLTMSSFTYFTLGEKDLKNLSLTLSSSRIIDEGKEKELVPQLDFNHKKNLFSDLDEESGYNHFIKMDKREAVLKSDEIELRIETDFGCVYLESDNNGSVFKTEHTASNKHRGLLLGFMDHPLFPRLVKKKNLYSKTIKLTFSQK